MASNFRSLVSGGYFSSTPFDRRLPVSIRCNNPGAINGASWEEMYPGFVDTVETTPGNKTTIFEAPEYGVAVWWELLRRYAATNVTKLGDIINRYGGGQDYSSYIKFVAKKTGFDEQRNISLDDNTTLLSFGRAMFEYEAGRPCPLSNEQILCGLKLGRAVSQDIQNKSLINAIEYATLSTDFNNIRDTSPVLQDLSAADTQVVPGIDLDVKILLGDLEKIPQLIIIGSNPDTIKQVQNLAAKTMAEIGYTYPRKSCAATLSHFLRTAGISIPVTTGAQNLADRLRINRKWMRVELGNQQPGDVGVCKSIANDVPGADHIYLVINVLNSDLMDIVDNQVQNNTHKRNASGKPTSNSAEVKTPTEYFLRASESGTNLMGLVEPQKIITTEEVPDEPTNDLPELFMDDGTSRL